jgi:hypothetical protein
MLANKGVQRFHDGPIHDEYFQDYYEQQHLWDQLY